MVRALFCTIYASDTWTLSWCRRTKRIWEIMSHNQLDGFVFSYCTVHSRWAEVCLTNETLVSEHIILSLNWKHRYKVTVTPVGTLRPSTGLWQTMRCRDSQSNWFSAAETTVCLCLGWHRSVMNAQQSAIELKVRSHMDSCMNAQWMYVHPHTQTDSASSAESHTVLL